MTYNISDICLYIINYSNKKEYDISNLKLQKLLYFVQAYFLIKTKRPCFTAKIEAWDIGPIIPKAYQKYAAYGSTNIPDTTVITQSNKSDFWNITSTDERLINAVIDKFADYSATDLTALTQKQAPWEDAYASSENREITIEALRSYFQ